MTSAIQVEAERAEHNGASGSHEAVSIFHELTEDATQNGGGSFCNSEREARVHFISRQAGLHIHNHPVDDANNKKEERDLKGGEFVFFGPHLVVLVTS